MKRLLLIVILLFSFITVNAESYYHKGDTYYFENQYELVSGVINENDIDFTFKTTRADRVKCNISVKMVEDDGEQYSELYHSYTFNTEGRYIFDLENFTEDGINYDIDTDCYVVEDYYSEIVDDSNFYNTHDDSKFTDEDFDIIFKIFNITDILFTGIVSSIILLSIVFIIYLSLAKPKTIEQVIEEATKMGYTVSEGKNDINSPFINVNRVIEINIKNDKAKFYLFDSREDTINYLYYITGKNIEKQRAKDKRKNVKYPNKFYCLNANGERMVLIKNTAFYYNGSIENAKEARKFAKKIGY